MGLVKKKLVKVEKQPGKELVGIKKKTKKEKKERKWTTKNIVLTILLSLGILGIGILIIFALYIIFTAGEFDEDKVYNKEMTVLNDKNGVEFARVGAENRETVYYDELPEVLIDAIVATEDARFFQHNGLDIARFAKASLGQLMGNKNAGGASTITMQVSKNNYTSTEASGIKGIVRKFTDIYFSIFKIEKVYTKQEIIQFYVNVPWLGDWAWGVEAACQRYFGKSVRDLTLAEASLIAGIFNNPLYYNPFTNPELATKRRSVVLDLMVRHGYITEEQKNIAESISVESLLLPEDERVYSDEQKYQSVIDVVLNEVRDKTGVEPYNVPMIIDTTIDTQVEDVLLKLDSGELGYEFVDDLVQTAVAVTDVEDGSVAGILGRRNQSKSKSAYNFATQMFRHPGSTAKPIFDYGPYLEYNNGSTYSPFFNECNMTYSNGQAIKNSDGSCGGIVTMRTALMYSRNIPALQAFQQVDPEKISEFVHNLGIDYGDTLLESMSIGGFDGVSPLQLSAAYAAFARGGYYIEPYSVRKITYIDTEETWEANPQREKVMSEETAFMINSMLMSTKGTGVAGNLNVSGTDLAAKSGTSTYDYSAIKNAGIPDSVAGSLSRDNWVDVYSPNYSISVWYGYDKLYKDHYTTANGGDNQRRKITAAVGSEIFKLKPAARFDVPDGVVKVNVEKWTFPAQLASENTPEDLITSEYFRKGTEPTEVSKRFAQLDNPTGGGYVYNGSAVTISWNPIEMPQAIDTNYLQNYFNTYYSKWAEKYYNERIDYNNNNFGTIGYQIYLKDESGLTNLGYTTNTTYTHECPTGDCTYVVKSAYSIYKTNMSSGLTIETTGSSVEMPDEVTIRHNGGDKVCFKVIADGVYDDSNSLIVYNRGVDVTSSALVTKNYYLNNNIVNSILLNQPGSYYINYDITYNGKNYSTRKTVNVCSNGCNDDNECI